MPEFIRIEDASFSYPEHNPDKRVTLSNINLKIGQAEFISLIGANGSGKSTLAKMLNALLLPDSGRIFVEGLDTQQQSSHARAP